MKINQHRKIFTVLIPFLQEKKVYIYTQRKKPKTRVIFYGVTQFGAIIRILFFSFLFIYFNLKIYNLYNNEKLFCI